MVQYEMNIYKVDFLRSLCSLVCYMIALHRLASPLRLCIHMFLAFSLSIHVLIALLLVPSSNVCDNVI
jgi:hypothetical protein